MKNAYSIRRKRSKRKKSKIAKIISSINIGCCLLGCSKYIRRGGICFRKCIQSLMFLFENKTYSRDISCEIDGKSFYVLSQFSSTLFLPLVISAFSIFFVCASVCVLLYLKHLSFSIALFIVYSIVHTYPRSISLQLATAR